MSSNLATLNPPLIQQLHQVGWELYERQAYSEAASIYRYLILEGAHDPTAWFLLGRCHQELGQESTAAQLFELAASLGGAQTLFGELAALLREGMTHDD